MSASERCPAIAVSGPRGECILPLDHEGEHKRVCGALHGPIDGPPQFCGLPDGHEGECVAVGYACSAKLVSAGSSFVCELDLGHEGEHRGHPYPPADGVEEPPTFWTDETVGAVPSGRTEESPQEEPAGASGLQDAPEGALEADAGEIKQTAPIFPAEMVLTSSGWWIQRLPDGGRQLKIVALQMTAQGPRPVMPAYVLEFATAEAWDAFKELIDRDGAPKPAKPQVLTATHLPPGMKL